MYVCLKLCQDNFFPHQISFFLWLLESSSDKSSNLASAKSSIMLSSGSSWLNGFPVRWLPKRKSSGLVKAFDFFSFSRCFAIRAATLHQPPVLMFSAGKLMKTHIAFFFFGIFEELSYLSASTLSSEENPLWFLSPCRFWSSSSTSLCKRYFVFPLGLASPSLSSFRNILSWQKLSFSVVYWSS